MKKIFTVLLMFLFILQTQAIVLAQQDESIETGEEVQLEESISLDDVKPVEDYKFSFETVAKNEEAELLIDKSVNALRVVSLKTGNYYDTKVMNGQVGNDIIKNIQKSDFYLTYYTDLTKATTETIDNYSQSITLNQVEYTPIKNGIRCSFTLGDESKVHLGMFPMYMSKERMHELILKYLDDDQIEELLGRNGYYTETSDKFIRNWESKKKDGTATKVAIPKLKRMYHFFYELGAYNEEELAKDNAEWGIEEENPNITLKVDVEYILDGKDLIVRVPADGIVTDSKYPVSDLTLTPYLLSGGVYDEGYIFVPDGCGGIINFNNGKTATPPLFIPIFGSDLLKNPHFYSETFVQSTLPVVGIKKNDIAILGIIEEGAEIATVTANVSGKVDEFNKVNVNFNLYHMERIPMTVGANNYMIKYTQKSYRKDITIRYKLLEGEEANYTGMAKAYKKYLKERGKLKENPIPEDAPLFIEMIASVPTKKSFLGIPYTTYTTMTSFNEAKDILSFLKEKGIKNIVLEYSDWANGGAKNTVFNKVKIIKGLGGKKGLSELLSYSEREGFELFPKIKLLTTYSMKGIRNNKDIARLLDNTRATMPSYNIATRQTNGIKEWLISPYFLQEYVPRILNWAGKLGLNKLAVDNAGVLLYGDYNNKRELLRSDALPMFENTLKILSAKCDLLFSNANSYAFSYASYIADLPTYDSGRRIIDYSVPFVQMVLENDIPYSMEDYNRYSLEGFEKYLLKAIETKSNLKWILTNGDESQFIQAYLSKDFNMEYYFRTHFERWKHKIRDYYVLYNEFYQKVKHAEIEKHEVISKDLVKVSYDNGVTVYINYSDKTQMLEGEKIEPLSYIIKQ